MALGFSRGRALPCPENDKLLYTGLPKKYTLELVIASYGEVIYPLL